MSLPLALGFAAAMGSGIATSQSQADANAQAARQFGQNLAFQRYQYEDQKRYQSYENHVKMMRQAGLNPALMFYGGASPYGSANVGGVSPTAAYGSVNQNNLPSSMASLVGAVSQDSVNESVKDVNATQSSKNVQDAAAQYINNMWRNQDWRFSLEGKREQNRLSRLQGDLAEKDLEFQTASLGNRIEQQEWQAQYWRANAASAIIAAKYADEQQQAQLKQALAAAEMSYATGQATLKQAHTEQMKAFAQYGKTPEERAKFFLATLNNLRQHTSLMNAEQKTSWVRAIGGTANGVLSNGVKLVKKGK